MNISTKLATLTLKNPLMPGSGPLTGNDIKMNYLSELGLGALVTKTIAPLGAEVVRPCIYGEKNAIYNSEMWSEYHSDQWADEFLPSVKADNDTPLFLSIGYTPEDMKILIPKLDAYAEAYELIPRYVGNDLKVVGEMVASARNLTVKPIWVKMNAGLPDPIGFAGKCMENGAQGVVAVTSLGPNMVVDLKRRGPVIGGEGGYAWTSGPYIKPLALATVRMIKDAYPEISVIGGGGVTSADDILEFLLVGADAVQMLSWAMLRGRDIYRKIIADLPKALEKYGFASIEEVKATKMIPARASLKPTFPVIDHEKCTKCKICVDNCPYFAMEFIDFVEVDHDQCFGCGLCESRCPPIAISGVL